MSLLIDRIIDFSIKNNDTDLQYKLIASIFSKEESIEMSSSFRKLIDAILSLKYNGPFKFIHSDFQAPFLIHQLIQKAFKMERKGATEILKEFLDIAVELKDIQIFSLIQNNLLIFGPNIDKKSLIHYMIISSLKLESEKILTSLEKTISDVLKSNSSVANLLKNLELYNQDKIDKNNFLQFLSTFNCSNLLNNS
jgi:hypothetical protein